MKTQTKALVKKNLKGLLKFVAFLGIFVLIFTQLSIVFDPKDGKDKTGLSRNVSYSYRAEDANVLDVVFIGNSNAYRAFNPIQLLEDKQITSCVIGKPMMTMSSAYSTLEDMFKTQKPKVVVFETNCLYLYLDTNDFSAQKASSSSPSVAVDSQQDKQESDDTSSDNGHGATQEQIGDFDFSAVKYDSKFIKNSVSFLNDALLSKVAYVAPLMKYHDRWEHLSINDFKDAKKRFYYITKGFLYSKTVKPFEYGDTYMGNKDDAPQKISASNMKYFDKIVSLCNKNGAKLALISVPSGTNWNYKRHNEVTVVAKQYGLHYVDYNVNLSEVKGFNWATDTKDHGDHLNTYGATKVMRAYENVLENEFKLGKSDITPTQVKNWNENANKFHSDIES